MASVTTHKYMIAHLMTLNNMPVEILDMMKALKIKESSKIQTALDNNCWAHYQPVQNHKTKTGIWEAYKKLLSWTEFFKQTRKANF